MASRQIDDQFAMPGDDRIGRKNEPAVRLFCEHLRGSLDLRSVADWSHNHFQTKSFRAVGSGAPAEQRIELVHIAVSGDAQIVLGNARAVEERGLAGVASFCI